MRAITAEKEFGIRRELPDANGERAIQQALLQPELRQPCRLQRLDVADRDQIADIVAP